MKVAGLDLVERFFAVASGIDLVARAFEQTRHDEPLSRLVVDEQNAPIGWGCELCHAGRIVLAVLSCAKCRARNSCRCGRGVRALKPSWRPAPAPGPSGTLPRARTRDASPK